MPRATLPAPFPRAVPSDTTAQSTLFRSFAPHTPSGEHRPALSSKAWAFRIEEGVTEYVKFWGNIVSGSNNSPSQTKKKIEKKSPGEFSFIVML